MESISESSLASSFTYTTSASISSYESTPLISSVLVVDFTFHPSISGISTASK